MRKRLLAITVILLFTIAAAGEAFARAGGGRSSGSRGSRGMSAPSRPYTPPSSPYQQGAAPAPAPQTPAQGGGFLRNMGAGMLGGLLGGMFAGGCDRRTAKQDADPSGTGTPKEETSGNGMGLFDILLLAGLAYLVFRFIMKRKQQQQSQQDSTYFPPPLPPVETGPSSVPFPGGAGGADRSQGIGRIRQMDPSFEEKTFQEQATDLFFRLQGAWTRRDLAPVGDMLTGEMRGLLQADVDGMKAKGQVNRLENIAVRSVEITEAWQESGMDYVTVRFLANLLDYTTDEAGKVLSGSDAAPVKFEEHWTLTRPVGPGAWKLSAIQQI